MMYDDKLVHKVVIWVFFGIRLWKEKEALVLWEFYKRFFDGPNFDQNNVGHLVVCYMHAL